MKKSILKKQKQMNKEMFNVKEKFMKMIKQNRIVWSADSGDEIVAKAIGIVNFEPIAKTASGDDWEYDNFEHYLGNDGKVQMGSLVYERQEFYREGLDGNVEMKKQIYICPDGGVSIFYTTLESNNCGCCDKEHCKLNRIYSIDQSLTLEEKEDILLQLVIEINQHLLSQKKLSTNP